MLQWMMAAGPCKRRTIVAAGFCGVASKIDYLRDEELIVGKASGGGERGIGFFYSVTDKGRRLVACPSGAVVEPRRIAFAGRYSGPDWAPVRSGAERMYPSAGTPT